MAIETFGLQKKLRFGIHLVTFLVVVGIVFGAIVKIDGAVLASGTLEVESRRLTVQHPDGGIVESIVVKDSMAVEKGDVLATLDGGDLRTRLLQTEATYFELVAQEARIEAERRAAQLARSQPIDKDPPLIDFPQEVREAAAVNDAVAEIMSAQLALYETFLRGETETVAAFKARVAGQDEQLSALDTQIATAQKALNRMQTLVSRGSASDAQLEASEAALASLTGERGKLVAERAETAISLQEHWEGLVGSAGDELQSLRPEIANLRAELEQLRHKIGLLEIKAPAAGMIYANSLNTEGQVVSSGQVLMYVIPRGERLVVRAQIKPADIDQVYVGQAVRINFSAFDALKTPEVPGEVVRLSPDVISNEQTGESFYEIDISFDSASLDQFGQRSVQPGMPVDAFLSTEPRTFLTYLLQPILESTGRSFREG